MRSLPLRRSSAWNESQAREFLATTRVPLRLACQSPSGFPLVSSLWFEFADDSLWCAMHRSAHVATLLARDPRCGFEVAPDTAPYRGVRGQGRATLVPERGGEQLERLLRRQLGGLDSPLARWLLSRVADELAVRIEPVWLTTWDFTSRMGGGSDHSTNAAPRVDSR
jgi:nitroimidazol reductase NimA-like FMN-containing flavoprotein (pyridoxamine 5'-phosphate oxidase superfamily)